MGICEHCADAESREVVSWASGALEQPSRGSVEEEGGPEATSIIMYDSTMYYVHRYIADTGTAAQ